MRQYDTILFDADGTLFDFLKSEETALRAALADFGVTVDEAGVRLYSGINDALWKALERREITKECLKVRRFEEFGEAYGFTCDFAALADTYAVHLSEQCFLMDGAEAICRKLAGEYRLYIVTNGIEFVQKRRFMKAPIRPYFSDLFISGEIGYEKPSPHFFEVVEKRIPGYDRTRTLLCGDSLTSDMAGGLGAGLDCCWFNPQKRPMPADMAIRYEIQALSELERILL